MIQAGHMDSKLEELWGEIEQYVELFTRHVLLTHHAMLLECVSVSKRMSPVGIIHLSIGERIDKVSLRK